MKVVFSSVDDQVLQTTPRVGMIGVAEPVFPFRRRSVGLVAFGERNWRFIYAIATAFVDAGSSAVASIIARAAQSQMSALGHDSRVCSATFCAATTLLFLMLGAIFGLYRRPYWANCSSQVRAAIRAYGLGALLIFSLVLMKRDIELIMPIAVWLLLIAPPVAVMARVAWQVIRGRLLARGWALERVLLILADNEAEEGPNRLRQLRSLGYIVLRQVRWAPHRPKWFLAEIKRQVGQRGATSILLPDLDLLADGCESLIPYARRTGLKLKLFSPALNRILGGAFVHDVAGITIESPLRFKVAKIRQVAKRAFDLVAAGMLLVLAMPIFLLVAVALKLESSGPVFFVQVRSLSKSTPGFGFYKFRSMRHNSEGLKAALRSANETSGALFKIRRDPRVTRVGRIIRRLSIDELPQLVNVIKGEMSLVGPRPLPMKDYEELMEGDPLELLYQRRARVMPGITGLWQVCGRSELGFSEMVLLDLYYAENYTIFLDLQILLHTICAVLIGRGAY